jgi:hypothetical protein
MSFDKFQANFVNENRKLKVILGLVLIIFAVGTAAILTERRYYLYQGREVFEERPLAVEVCRLSFMSLAEGSPNPFVVDKKIIALVKQEPFSLNVEKMLMVKSTAENHCKVILRSEGKLLAFQITLAGLDDNPFYYQLIQLDEVGVEKGEI